MLRGCHLGCRVPQAPRGVFLQVLESGLRRVVRSVFGRAGARLSQMLPCREELALWGPHQGPW